MAEIGISTYVRPASATMVSANAMPGQTFTRAHLLDLVRDDADIFDRTLDRHVANLRKKIQTDPASPRYIITVFGVGYRFMS